jgi:hypothetical protein
MTRTLFPQKMIFIHFKRSLKLEADGRADGKIDAVGQIDEQLLTRCGTGHQTCLTFHLAEGFGCLFQPARSSRRTIKALHKNLEKKFII